MNYHKYFNYVTTVMYTMSYMVLVHNTSLHMLTGFYSKVVFN